MRCKRRTFVLAAVSLGLCAASGLLWARSTSAFDRLETPMAAFTSHAGQIHVLHQRTVAGPPPPAADWGTYHLPAEDAPDRTDWYRDPDLDERRLGFGLVRGTVGTGPEDLPPLTRYTAVIIPYWFMTLIFALPFGVVIAKQVRAGRRRSHAGFPVSS